MNVVGKVSSFITQGVYSVATPFHPFGGAVDIIVVKQNDGTYRSTPWYVRFGKFQGVLKGAEKVVRIEVNGVEANFNMYLDNSGEAYFVREDDPDKDDNECYKDSDNGIRDDNNNSSTDYSNIDSGSKDNDFFVEENSDFNSSEVEVRDERVTLGMDRLERVESDVGRIFYDLEDSMEHYSEFNLDSIEQELVEEKSNSEVVLVSVDGHILTAPISTSGRLDDEDMQLSTPPFHLGPGEGTEEFSRSEDISTGNNNINNNLNDLDYKVTTENEEHLNNHEEESPQGSSNEEKKICIEGGSENSEKNGGGSENSDKKEGSPENMSSRLKRRDVFKSCLELTALSAKHEQESTVEIAGDDVDPNKSSLVNDERTEEGNLEISRDGENERNTFGMMDQDCADSSIQGEPVSNNEELLKQVEIDQTVGRMNNNGEEYPASDVCSNSGHVEAHSDASLEVTKSDLSSRVQISLCGKLLHPGMGSSAAEEAFNTNRISVEEFKLSASSIIKNENLILRIQGKYLKWDKASHIVLGMTAFGLDPPVGLEYAIPVEKETKEEEGEEDDEDEDEDEGSEIVGSTQSRRWRLWPIPFSRRVKTLEHSGSNSSSNEEVFVDSDSQRAVVTPKAHAVSDSPRKQIIRTNVPTTDQITSLNLKEGQNSVTFVFSTRVLGSQKVEAHIYLWKWNTRIVISDVDGTITKSDVLGQFMPLVGKDWTHSGIARLFCAIKENGYQLLFLSARAIVQSYLTKNFLFNLKQDGKSLPSGPVVISPDGLFPSLYREVIRRAPHEFKIACLEDIKALFPPDYNPFYAGFGNRDTDELSYRKIGIPKGKIFIINPKGEVAINHRIDAKSYTSLHTLVNDMFPPTSLVEQEDYNSWNYWKVPLPDID